MATALPQLPAPPAATAARFDKDGRPTPAQVEYETRLQVYLKAVGLIAQQAASDGASALAHIAAPQSTAT